MQRISGWPVLAIFWLLARRGPIRFLIAYSPRILVTAAGLATSHHRLLVFLIFIALFSIFGRSKGLSIRSAAILTTLPSSCPSASIFTIA